MAFTPGGPSWRASSAGGCGTSCISPSSSRTARAPAATSPPSIPHAAPDGYTLLMGNNSILATNAALYKKLAYDQRNFIPISLISTQTNILVVNPRCRRTRWPN